MQNTHGQSRFTLPATPLVTRNFSHYPTRTLPEVKNPYSSVCFYYSYYRLLVNVRWKEIRLSHQNEISERICVLCIWDTFQAEQGKGFHRNSCKFITLYSAGNLHILYWFSPNVLKRKIKQFSDILQTFRSTRLVIWERRFKEVPKYKSQKGMKLQWNNCAAHTLSISVGRARLAFSGWGGAKHPWYWRLQCWTSYFSEEKDDHGWMTVRSRRL